MARRRLYSGLLRGLAVGGLAVGALASAGLALALAQAPPPVTPGVPPKGPRGASSPIEQDKPAYYQADQVEYDRDQGVVTLTGHVEFWQNDRVLLADRVTHDRNTNVTAASGHVVLLEPDGQTMFSDYAELSGGMKEGVLAGLGTLMAEGGRLVANGGRRTSGAINELSRAVYSTCDLCADDPSRAPLWQIRAREAVQDKENKKIEYHDAVIEMFGLPVLWLPYLTHPDPSEKRASGILPPNIGYSKRLGLFAGVPYYWVLDGQSDATITPILASKNGPAVEMQDRRRFNDGTLTINSSLANEKGELGGHLFAKGQFAIDETWRWGFDINRASSSTYMRDFRVQGWADVLTSQLYMEGFGQGSYARVDARQYQGLTNSIIARKLPSVLPRAEYSLIGPQDGLGGRTTVDMDAFNVVRDEGALTRRLHFSTQWDRPAIGPVGDVWKLSARLDSAAYDANKFNYQPNYGASGDARSAQAMTTVAVELRWPLVRGSASGSTQVLEPIVQVIAAPRSTNYVTALIPNEDSLDTDFTDANLFSLNRHTGIDRLEGGMRANVALHGAWYLRNGTVLDAQIGQAFRMQRDTSFAAGTGLEKTASDIVSHLTVAPMPGLDVTTRQRFDHTSGRLTYIDALTGVGDTLLRVTGGYIYSATNLYNYYDTAPTVPKINRPRNELTLGFTSGFGAWKLHAAARRDMALNKMTSLSAGFSYEDECFVFDASLYRRYTSINNDHGTSMILFQITLKTVGEFGFHAL